MGENQDGDEGLLPSCLRPLWTIWADGSVDGLRKKLIAYVRRKFPYASRGNEFAEDVVGEAFDSAVRVLSKGRTIHYFAAWFYKTVRLIAAKRIEHASILHEHGREVAAALHPGLRKDVILEEHEQRDAAFLEKALEHATDLAPRIGTGQVREVMNLFLEAIRNDVVDFPPARIAEILGISEPQARTLLHRGLNRLRREAEREGINLPSEFDPEAHEPYGMVLEVTSHEGEKE